MIEESRSSTILPTMALTQSEVARQSGSISTTTPRSGCSCVWMLRCLGTVVVIALLARRADAGKRYSYFWWDISLLQSENQQVDFTGTQRRLIDSGAINVSLIHESRKLFFLNCKESMSSMPWNCSRTTQTQVSADVPARPPPYFGKFIDLSTRQAAFVHALSTAVLLQEMVREKILCSNLECLLRNSTGCRWEPCTTSSFSCCMRLVKLFVSAGERQGRQMSEETYSNRVLINDHNRKTGISVFATSGMEDVTTCTGISGTCAINHRYRLVKKNGALTKVRELYDTAHEIKIIKDRANTKHIVLKSAVTRDRQLIDLENKRNQPTYSNLVYQRKSPGFCHRKYGLPGPSGRECSEDGTKEGITCEKLCCGRGIVRRVKTEIFPVCLSSQEVFVYCCRFNCLGGYQYIPRNTTISYCR